MLLILTLSLPFVQSKLAKVVTKRINKEYNTNIVVKKLDLSFLGNVNLKGVEIRDHHNDTLIFVNSLRTSLKNAKRIIDNNVDLGDITLSGAYFYMKKYKGEEDDNLSIFIKSFDNDSIKKEPSKNPFALRTKNIYVDNLTFKLFNFDKKNPLEYAAYNAGGNIQDFSVIGPDVKANIRGLYLKDNRNIYVTNLTTDFSYTKKQMLFNKTTLLTDNKTDLKGDIAFNYNRKDFAHFTDKVRLSADFKKSVLSVKDLNKIYRELRGSDKLKFTGNVQGTLNNFSVMDLNMRSVRGLVVKGDLGFVNAFNSDRGFIFDGDLKRVSSNYNQLKSLLPNVLGKILPTNFKKIGNFSLEGVIKLTPEQMDATISLDSDIGSTISDLQFSNIDNIDNATYNGEIEFIDLELGKVTDNEELGKVSLKADVLGSGFNVDNINSTIIGNVSMLNFRGYSYKDFKVNGQFQNKKFDGILKADDENAKLKFKGLADFSSAINKFDFFADIDKLDLKKTNLFVRDSVSEIKGKIRLDIVGNTFDNIVGKAEFKHLTYKNDKKVFSFKDFQVNSSIKDSIKTIEVNSKDIVKGKLEGKFLFKDILPVFQNALGSVYTNYMPIEVSPNQYVNFDFRIYNQIVDVFLPKVSIGNNTRIKGKIDANKNAVKLTFTSPNVSAYGNLIDEIVLRVDNKNKLYNTHLTAKDVKTKYYNISKLNLLNRTANDTLFFKSTFLGGKKEENFNLDFFYTIDENRSSVVGLQKSTLSHNSYNWIINPKNDKNNKVAFNIREKLYNISPFEFVSGEQKIEFGGTIKGEKNKDVQAEFTNVQLISFLPQIKKFSLTGLLNGKVSLKENEELVEPLADIVINDVIVNDFSQGTLKLKVSGENSLNKYKVDASLRDYEFDNVKIVGGLDFSQKEPQVDLNVKFREYELNGFTELGKGVISNLRGRLSGAFTAKGPALNPVFEGGLNLIEAGVTFPYLNIDFDFVDNTNIQLLNQSFFFNSMVLKDTKYDTKGNLSGSVTHQDFDKWYMKLNIDTDNLLVLDTKEAEEIPYYGKGFIKGNARIRGLTSNLGIRVNGSTQPNTKFVIPLSDVTTVDNYKLIRFKTNDKEENLEELSIEKIKGLNLKFDLTVTKDAVAQVVIDKVSGSDLIGSGTGDLSIEIDTRGKFLMDGGITIDNGKYNFKYGGGIISKPFTVQKGGTISWTGDPLNAQLDLTAIYRTKANPAQLLDNINSTRKIDIDLYTKITGGLFDSKQQFDIKIPNANSTVASELEFRLNENDLNTKMQHFTFLLAFGTFYNQETLGNSASSGLTGTAAQAVSRILSSVINKEGGKIKFGVGYTQGDRGRVNQVNSINDQVDVSVSTQISDRILVNGSVGVPVGGGNGNTQSSVVGEVNIEVLLNEEGTLRSSFFNKPNDVQFDIENEGYTQGVGLSYQVNFNTLSELGEKLGFKKKKKEKVAKKDSIIVKKRKLINFRTKTDTTKTKNEQKN